VTPVPWRNVRRERCFRAMNGISISTAPGPKDPAYVDRYRAGSEGPGLRLTATAPGPKDPAYLEP
jgi:hypothetical protein